MMKKVVAIIVFVLVVCTIAGCTTTNNTNQTPSATSSSTSSAATQHDAFLEKYLSAFKNVSYSNSSMHVRAWELTWINSTSAHLQWTAVVKPSNTTRNLDVNYTVFPTTQDATNYLNAMNKTAYSLASTEYLASPSGGTYQEAVGHAPQIYKYYLYNEGNPSNISEYRRHEILQLDNVVGVATGKVL